MAFGLAAKNNLNVLLSCQAGNGYIEVANIQMAVPFLTADSIGIKPHVHWLVVVPELTNQFAVKAGHLCNFLEVGFQNLLESRYSTACCKEFIKHCSPFGSCCALTALTK
eukprot:770073-Ditylum_brightwellii.AAC.1